jgi:hypothetical protein
LRDRAEDIGRESRTEEEKRNIGKEKEKKNRRNTHSPPKREKVERSEDNINKYM